jgi:hypothetical protein
MTLTEHM